MRVHELAAELSVESSELIRVAHGQEILVKSHMSTLDEQEVQTLRQAFARRPGRRPRPATADADQPPSVEPGEANGEQAAAAPTPEETAPETAQSPDGPASEPAREPAAPATGGEQAASGGEEAPPGNQRQERRRRGGKPPHGGPRGRGTPLSQEDPFWQFGTPVEYWGSSRGGQATGGRDPSGLAPDDPYWQFGSPPESWGSSRKKAERPQPGQRPRGYLECQQCGVKIEKKKAHGEGRVRCPFCSRPMREVKQ